MIFRIADEDRAVGVDINAMGTFQGALLRVAVGAVAFLAGAADDVDRAGRGIDHADGMALGVSQEDAARRRPRR